MDDLEQEVNAAYLRLRGARLYLLDYENTDTSHYESPMLRSHHQSLQEARIKLENVKEDIERLKLIIALRSNHPMPDEIKKAIGLMLMDYEHDDWVDVREWMEQ